MGDIDMFLLVGSLALVTVMHPPTDAFHEVH